MRVKWAWLSQGHAGTRASSLFLWPPSVRRSANGGHLQMWIEGKVGNPATVHSNVCLREVGPPNEDD